MKYLVYIALLAIVVTGCKARKGNASTEDGRTSKMSDQKEALFRSRLVQATTEKVLGNYEEAEKLFMKCLEINSKSAVVYFELSGIYKFQRNATAALAAAEKAVELNSSNEWYKTNLAVMYKELGYYAKAEELYEQLVEEHPARSEYLFTLAEANLYQGKISEAIEIYDKIEEKLGATEELTLHKHRLYLQLNEPEKAVAEVQKLIDENPKEVRYYGILAELYENEGEPEKALELYNKILEMEPENGHVHLSLYEYYKYHGNKEKSFEELKLAFGNGTVDIDTKMQIMLQFFNNSERNEEVKEQAYELSELLVNTHPDEAKSFSMYGDFLSRDDKLEKALEMFKKAAEIDQSKFPIWSQIMFLESDLKAFDQMAEDSKVAMELFPTHPTFFFFNGVANSQLKNYDAAIEVLNTGKELVFDNPDLLAEFYQYLGDAYHGNSNHAMSDESYDKSLEYNARNPYVLNNYSFYLSLRREKLDKAEEMALKANELAPNIPSFLDTYGWVLFVRGKYMDAEVWLQKALDNGGDSSGTILEHYGDVMYKLNRLTDALDYWNRAKNAGDASDMIDKKIEEKSYFE